MKLGHQAKRFLCCIAVCVLPAGHIAAKTKDEKLAALLNGVYKKSPTAISTFPAQGFHNGLQGLIREHQLVITRSDGSCRSNGDCEVWIFLTRNGYRLHRPSDTGAFCGAQASWKSSDERLRDWYPTSGLAHAITSGNAALALNMIDDKNESYCK